jgi:hypothetical protein
MRCRCDDGSRQCDEVGGTLVVLANWQGRAVFPRAKAAIAVKPRSKSVQPATMHAKVYQQLHLALILDPRTVLEA